MWRTEGNTARLSIEPLSAKLNQLRLAQGVFELRFGDRLMEGARILQVRASVAALDRDERLLDSYVRGNDLIACYAPWPQREVGPQLCWRCIDQADLAAVGLELIISVQTDLLDTDPGLTIGSEVPQGTVWRLVAADKPQFERITFPDEPLASYPTRQPAVLLYRPADVGCSFVEMIHPSDFAGAVLAAPPQGAGGYFSSFRLFDERLEKGVIRRGRLQGLFVARDGDQETAWNCYRRFAASEIPLTT
ncbi:MAG: hypothetical protein NTY19_09945 [Planctomycetota bacterium]|nr:hypothetical protein [Planctomycetota bacterium]